jgi:hypothetical protein
LEVQHGFCCPVEQDVVLSGFAAHEFAQQHPGHGTGQVCAGQHDSALPSKQPLTFAAWQQVPAWLHLVSARPPTSAFPARSTVASTSITIRVLPTLAVILLFSSKYDRLVFNVQGHNSNR